MRKSYIPRVASRDRHRLGSFKYYVRGRKVIVRSQPQSQTDRKEKKYNDQEEEKEDGMLKDE